MCIAVHSLSSPLPAGDYAGFPGCGLLRLHSTFRHDLKIYASDEGRVQMTAAAFAKVLALVLPQSQLPLGREAEFGELVRKFQRVLCANSEKFLLLVGVHPMLLRIINRVGSLICTPAPPSRLSFDLWDHRSLGEVEQKEN